MYKPTKTNMYATIINPFFVLVSLATATGVFLHDTHIDKAAAVATLPTSMVTAETSTKMIHLAPNDLHTHVERASVGHASLLHTSPCLMPRVSEDKKHLLQRHVGKGHHAFDNYNLPLV